MNDSTREISPLRQRMLEDMRLRKLAPHTQASYVRAVRRLASYLRRPPDTATVEDLRDFQLHLVDRGTSPITLNATITGLKFFFDVTLDRSELMAKMKPVFVPRTLPVVLSREEVGSLIDSKWQTRAQLHTREWRTKFSGKNHKLLIVLAPRDGTAIAMKRSGISATS